MKVAVVSAAALPSPAPSYGGLESIAAYTAESLAEKHDVTLFAAKGSRTEKATLFETVAPAYEPSADFPIEHAAWEMMKDELPKFDVVFDHSHAFHAFRLKRQNRKVKVVKVFHDLLCSRTPPPRDTYDLLCGVSKFHGKFLEAQWGVPVGHLYNGIPTERLTYSAQKKDYILFLSRMDPGKGAHVFLDILQGLDDLPHAIIAGDDDPQHGISNEYRRMIAQRAGWLGVDYLGEVSDDKKKELLAGARMVLVPLADPYREVFGIWMVEALASGTPVFTLDKGACSEILNRKVGGVADTPENLRLGLQAWLRNDFEFDPLVCRTWGQRFDIRVTGEAYCETVDSLTK
jgi:glycosyltransferase involved in cell wall biosynthesis